MSPSRHALALATALLFAGAILKAQAPAGQPESQPASRPGGPRPPDRTSLGLDAGYASFDGDIAPWKLGALSLSRRTSAGSLAGRVTLARRFGITGTQYEADAYPRFGAATYAYLNAGWSPSSIFPRWRMGAELFTNLPDAYEASLGFRQLRFDGSPVTLLTGSLGKYAGNYWLSLRPYVRTSGGGTAASAALAARRYYETADEYFGARLGYGSTPGERLTAADLARTSSFTAALQGSRALAPRLVGTAEASYEREELAPSRYRNRYELTAGARVDF